ncbi:unnamed protein product [Prorocentrum cordatum]|uniref:Uncharacterized protein n=1 Tax=Prorocentrum cordatum TaxID=2364126 RepID=A0ABN9VP77_9DINO|nr:unnamed protein product [Polarella glacialis]
MLGFRDQDPDLTTEESYAPTAARTARQVFLQKAAHFKMRELERDLFARPTGEIAKMLGLKPEQAAILKKPAYGLVQALRARHKAVNRRLQDFGWRHLEPDPCVRILARTTDAGAPDQIVAMALFHVGDFLFAGRVSDEIWRKARQQVIEAFRWTEWDYDAFTQRGVDITQRADIGSTLSQAAYAEHAREPAVEKGTQTGQDILAELSSLQSKTESCTVEDLVKVNKRIKRSKETIERVLEIFPFSKPDLAAVGWGDAAFGDRADGKFTVTTGTRDCAHEFVDKWRNGCL